MRRPVWFRKDGGLHWSPCTWQGWAVVGVFVAGLTGWMAQTAPKSPAVAVVGALAGAAAVVWVAVATDDTHGRGA